MNDILNNVSSLASFIGSLTVVGGALMWVYNKAIGEPRERKRLEESKKREDKMLELISESNNPLVDSINNLNNLLSESQRDRAKLNDIAVAHRGKLSKHKTILEHHDDRILTLEVINGIKSVSITGKDKDIYGDSELD